MVRRGFLYAGTCELRIRRDVENRSMDMLVSRCGIGDCRACFCVRASQKACVKALRGRLHRRIHPLLSGWCLCSSRRRVLRICALASVDQPGTFACCRRGAAHPILESDRKVKPAPNQITEPNAGARRQLPVRTRWAARVARFYRWAQERRVFP